MIKYFLLICVSLFSISTAFAVEESIINFDFYELGNQDEIMQNGYSREFNNAYNFAYKYGITTMDTIYKAHMDDQLNRISMAKMLSNYSINILKKKIDTSKDCSFSDVSTDLDVLYDNGATHACQLGIMGVGLDEFRPYDTVTRAEFITAIGRLLYNIKDNEDIYYSVHIKTLNNLGIIKNADPNLEELRGYVMIVLMRSAMDGDDPSYRVYETTPNFIGIVVDPHFYDETSIVFVYNPNTSGLPLNKGVEIKSVGYERGDYLGIEFDGEIEDAELGTYAKIGEISSITKIGNVKKNYFVKRDNSQYELKYDNYQENPIIDTFIYQGELEDGRYVKNETGYTYTFNDLGIKIMTPLGWRYEFPSADPYDLFVRKGVEIRKTGGDDIPPSWVEYIKIYSKGENEFLEDIIKQRHLNPGCLLESGVLMNGLKGIDGIGYYITNPTDDGIYSSTIRNIECFPDDEDNYSVVNDARIQFFEPAKDKGKYYKIRFQKFPSIFGKIETI